MNPATIQLIVALLPIAEKLVFEIGGKLIELNTSDLTDPQAILGALADAKAEGFPVLTFKPGA